MRKVTHPKKYKVLVVDDDPDIRETVASFLSSEGHLCHIAKDGAEALEMTCSSHFDALITDFRMPRMNGVMLAAEVLKHHRSFPIMMMTRSTGEVTAEKLFLAGIRDFLYKPFSMDELSVRFMRMMRSSDSLE